MQLRTRRAFALATAGTMLLAACGNSTDSKASLTTRDESVKSAVKAGDKVQAGAAATTAAGGSDRSLESAAATSVSAQGAKEAVPAAPGVKGSGAGAPASAVPPALQPIDLGRSIIFTATVSVQVDSVAVASEEALRTIQGFGGFLFGQQAVSEQLPASVLTFKVLPKDFQAALAKLGGLGKLLNQKVSTDDVTERVVDLQSRINTSQASVERLRAFLAGATDIATVTKLETELLARETQLEQLKGQIRTVQAQFDLATITLALSQKAPPVPAGPALALVVTAYKGSDEGASCPGEDSLEAKEGNKLTFCYVIVNKGSSAVKEIKLDDVGLNLEMKRLHLVSGDPSATLAPGQRIVLAGTVTAQMDASPRPRVRAVALDRDGNPERVQVPVEIEGMTLSIAQDTSLPGFSDALQGGWHALQWIFGLLLVLAGALLPFFWVPVPIWFALRQRRKRAGRRPPKDGKTVAGAPWFPSNPQGQMAGPVSGGPGSNPPADQPTPPQA